MGVAEVAAALGTSRQRVSALARQRRGLPPPVAELASGPVLVGVNAAPLHRGVGPPPRAARPVAGSDGVARRSSRRTSCAGSSRNHTSDPQASSATTRRKGAEVRLVKAVTNRQLVAAIPWPTAHSVSGTRAYAQQMQSSNGTKNRYCCSNHDPLKAGGQDRRCTERRIRANELDAFVFDQVRAVLGRPDVLLAGERALAGRGPGGRRRAARRPARVVADARATSPRSRARRVPRARSWPMSPWTAIRSNANVNPGRWASGWERRWVRLR